MYNKPDYLILWATLRITGLCEGNPALVSFAHTLQDHFAGVETITLWRHDMETFSALLTLCEANPPVTGGFSS